MLINFSLSIEKYHLNYGHEIVFCLLFTYNCDFFLTENIYEVYSE